MLTSEQLAALKTELQSVDGLGNPVYPGVPASTGAALAALNNHSTTMVKPRMVTARTVMAEIDGGSIALDAIESFTNGAPGNGQETPHSAAKWAMKFLTQGLEIDIGHARTRAMVDALVAAGKITAAQGDALKGLAVQPASRAEVLFGAGVSVSEQDIIAAMAA